MFCGNCGTQIDENMKFCPKCGTLVIHKSGAYQTDNKLKKEQSTFPNVSHTKKKLILPAVIIIIIIAAGLLINLKSGSAEKVAVKACKTTLNGDIKAYYKLLAPPYQDYMVGSDGWYADEEEFQETLLEYAEDKRSEIASKCGEDFKVSFEVVETKTCDKETLEAVKKELKNDYYYDADKIKDAAVVTVSIQASGSEGAGNWTTQEACVKIGGSWYIHRPGLNAL